MEKYLVKNTVFGKFHIRLDSGMKVSIDLTLVTFCILCSRIKLKTQND